MKLTKETLKQIIKEELEAVMSEALGGKQGLIKYIMDVNADERSKQEAIELINQLVADDDEGNKYAEDLAQELSQSVPDEWLSSWINYAQREVDFLAPEPSDKPKRKPSRRKTRRTNAALFEGE